MRTPFVLYNIPLVVEILLSTTVCADDRQTKKVFGRTAPPVNADVLAGTVYIIGNLRHSALFYERIRVNIIFAPEEDRESTIIQKNPESPSRLRRKADIPPLHQVAIIPLAPASSSAFCSS